MQPAAISKKAASNTKSAPSLWQQIVKNKSAYLFLLPKAILFICFLAIPVAWAFMLAFQKYNVLMDSEWVGLDNFRQIFQSSVYPIALWNTLKFTLISVPANIFMALLLSLMIFPLSQRAQTFYRAAFYLPGVASGVVIAMIWRYLLSTNGLLNGILQGVGLDQIPWLTSSAWALGSVILMGIFTPPGAAIIYYLAAMGNIPKELYEAAEIDGAGALHKWWSITLPILKPTTFYLTIMSTIASFQVFTSVLILTNGGPGHATKTLTFQIWDTAFGGDLDFGYASAQAIILFAMIMALALFQYRFLRSDES
jgi:multiple sugar transport system permease protein